MIATNLRLLVIKKEININYYILDVKTVTYGFGTLNLGKTMRSCLIPDSKVVGHDDVTGQNQP